jgi:hypothetical protein
MVRFAVIHRNRHFLDGNLAGGLITETFARTIVEASPLFGLGTDCIQPYSFLSCLIAFICSASGKSL